MAARHCLALCALPGLMLAGTVQAQWMPGHEINCQVSDSQSSIPLVSNPQSADIGELLTPWIYMDAERSCAGNVAEHERDTRIGTMRTNALVLRLPGNVEPANIPAVMDEGQAHSVYKVPGHEGIGYILKARHHEHNTGALWSAVNLIAGNEYEGIGFNWSYSYTPPVQKTPWGLIRAAFQIALVKTGEVPQWPPALASIDFSPVEHNARMEMAMAPSGSEIFFWQPAIDTWEQLLFSANAEQSNSGASCLPRTPGMTHVVLSPADISEFGSYGSIAKETYFSLIWDCPPLNGIRYEFHISSGKPSPGAAQGLIPQEHPSGARGVAIQVFEDHNGSTPFIPGGHYVPIELGVQKSLARSEDGYHPGQSVIKLPLKAQYYKIATDTGNDVMSAGDVEAGLRMVIQFN